jgi:hypothetical protein
MNRPTLRGEIAMNWEWKVGDEAILDGSQRVFVKVVSGDGKTCRIGVIRDDENYGDIIDSSRLTSPLKPVGEADLLVVALCGPARSGKDTAARSLAASHGFRRLALADGIRRAFAAVNEPTWDALKELDAAGKSARWALQVMGTEAREEVGAADHWVDHVGLTIRYFSHHHPAPIRRWVIPDLRYPREAERLADMVSFMGGRFEVWKVVRPDLRPIAEAAHSSETSVDDVRPDRLIDNSRGMDHMDRQVAAFAGKFTEGTR